MRIVIAVLVVAGLSIVALLTFTSGSRATEGASPRNEAASFDPTEVVLGLRGLREDHAATLRRLEELEQRFMLMESAARRVPASESAGVPEDVSGEDYDEVMSLLASLKNPGEAPSAELQSLVLDVLEVKEEREREERELRRAEQQVARMDERMKRMAEELGLDAYQEKEMRTILTDEEARRSELFETMRDGGGVFDRGTMRESMREIHEESLEKAEAVLTPDQYARYQESNSGGRGGFGGRGGGGGGDSGGGGGGGRRGR